MRYKQLPLCTEPNEVNAAMLTPREVLERAIAEHRPSHVFALFSGGHDSLVCTHITAQHPRFSAVVHINTGIGIEETREFVRETCRQHGWPLLEYKAPEGCYEQNVLEHGMPGGPVQHSIVYKYLKDDQICRLVRDHKQRRGDRIVLSTGVRQAESKRRMKIHPTHIRREGAMIWVNPILTWSSLDVTRYIADHGLQRNRVVDLLHRSGECLCGALAAPEELDWIAMWYPDVASHIRDLERQCYERGLPWQWGNKLVEPPNPRQKMLPLCSSCQTRWEMQAAAKQPVGAAEA